MNKIFGWFKSYNDYSKGDRNAIIILCVLILLLLTAKIIVQNIQPKSKYNYKDYEQLLSDLDVKKGLNKSGKALFAFDPNTINPEMLDSLDLPENIKRNMLNYRKAGGRFFTTFQVGKIYGMNDSIFAAIENYIIIAEKTESVSYKSIENHIQTEITDEPAIAQSKPALVQIELNSADSTELVQLNGIGSVYANRILKYRELLGGFYSTSQLLEVYNFSEETFRTIEGNISVDTVLIKKIRLNFAEYPDMLRHPYLQKKQVEAVLNYRNKNGSFHDIFQLKSSGIIDSETFSKVRPYLTCR